MSHRVEEQPVLNAENQEATPQVETAPPSLSNSPPTASHHGLPAADLPARVADVSRRVEEQQVLNVQAAATSGDSTIKRERKLMAGDLS